VQALKKERKTIKHKDEVVKEIKEKLNNSKGVILVDFCGLSADEMGDLRRKLKESASELKVVKNTLALRALSGSPLSESKEFFVGPTAFVFSFEDIVKTAKTLVDYTKEAESLKFKGALVDGKVCGSEDVISISKLPSREVLMAQMLGTMRAPIQGLLGVLTANLSALIAVLNAIKEKKKEG